MTAIDPALYWEARYRQQAIELDAAETKLRVVEKRAALERVLRQIELSSHAVNFSAHTYLWDDRHTALVETGQDLGQTGQSVD